VEGLEVEDYGAGGLDGALSYFGAYAYVSFPVSPLFLTFLTTHLFEV
jgi:hypothetical protein